MGVASYLVVDEEIPNLRASIEEKSASIFETKAGKAQLEVSCLARQKENSEDEPFAVKRNVELNSTEQLEALQKEHDDHFQIFKIRQARSWSTLNISNELFQEFARLFGVFQALWKCVFTFRMRSEEHEYDFPGFKSQRVPTSGGPLECAYVLRRVELHGRRITEDESPWSIRQTAVYHKLNPHMLRKSVRSMPEHQSVYLLINPSNSGEQQVDQLLELAHFKEQEIPHFFIHSLLIADSLHGWMEYLAWIERDLKDRSDRITFSKLGTMEKDFSFSVRDRQALKVLEDRVIDLQIIIGTLLSNVKGIRKHSRDFCRTHCKTSESEHCPCASVFDKFDSFLEEIELCKERASILRDRVFSSAQLLSDLLRYEDQRALKELTAQSQEENKTMLSLAEKSTKDAEAMKVLTIIGLVYLPTTFVANFFSTEFVKAGDDGNLSIAPQTWLLAVIALPLTVLTIVTWWLSSNHL
ncbi:hypothetical protein MPH_03059 [Macrophomina phaseolina MS6]|uniref:CorA-like transporter domain-containing protein n=1 Tax=Macrophomina phaseolina (strain MS6) TaxID=1126212 RepID=K2RY44_MACPH|nr:hypothetical protein MPH_03059 [Macrophomina phaseolina MS6]